MRAVLTGMLGVLAGMSSTLAEMPGELITAQNAVLCVAPDNLDIAKQAAAAKSWRVLQAMGCFRTVAGIRIRLVEGAPIHEPWRVRFYPAGISEGVELWGLATSFTPPIGSVPVGDAGI
jgi:hypothetical protein